jgi:hypothetical protein
MLPESTLASDLAYIVSIGVFALLTGTHPQMGE